MNQHCTLQNIQYQGFDAILLKNGQIELCIVPELGGKIASIIHTDTQREWLWHNPYLPQKAVVYDGSFVEIFDTGGLDECFPAISAGPYPDFPWEGVCIPDHGELWCQPWQVEIIESSSEKVVLSMVCKGVRFPYRFERTLTMTADSPTLTLDYQVTNLTRFDMPFVWCIHPLLKIEEGMRLTLPNGVDKVRVEGGINGLYKHGSSAEWPHPDLSYVPAGDSGRAYKIFTPILDGKAPVETAIYDPSGEHALTFRFSPQQINQVAIWMNYGAWSGSGSAPYFNLGLEPCIGSKDSLADAKRADEYGLLPANQTKSWSLELEIT
ncbi:MAG: hypothetical protein ACI85U_002055 [Candidatus Promineifilaceae bacterium]|jgi:hypothetical protein